MSFQKAAKFPFWWLPCILFSRRLFLYLILEISFLFVVMRFPLMRNKMSIQNLYLRELKQTCIEDFLQTALLIYAATQDRKHGKNLNPSSHDTFLLKIKTPKMGIQGNNPHIFLWHIYDRKFFKKIFFRPNGS